MQTQLLNELATFLAGQGLHADLLPMVQRYYLPLAVRLKDLNGQKQQGSERGGPLLLGINGAQGSGKSTLTKALDIICRQQFGWRVAVLSLDDLYLSRAAREKLARQVHPLLATRGVPGTHDVALGIRTIAALRAAKTGDAVSLPRFDKANDDPVPPAFRESVKGPFDLLIFEGWCLGATPQKENELATACNELESKEDGGRIWRHYVNSQLAEAYPPLFAGIDYRVFLKVPDFDAVLRWRCEQEELLRATRAGGARLMDGPALERFVQHFERLTLHQLITQPAISDTVFELAREHRIASEVVRG
jgi:D-glycerate 3-kinase